MSIIDEVAEENLSFRSNDSLKTKMGKLGIFDKHYYKHMQNKFSGCNECHSHGHSDVIEQQSDSFSENSIHSYTGEGMPKDKQKPLSKDFSKIIPLTQS